MMPYTSLLMDVVTNSPNVSNSVMSDEEIKRLLASEYSIRWFDTGTEIALIMTYAILILFGATGNGLVCYVVARNAHMRTPRNVFIINLAISDFTLCVFTQPFTLLKLITLHWSFGEFMCKFVPTFQGTNVFVSVVSITAIALDRFQVIVFPTKDSMKKVGGLIALLTIWIISFLMASPMLIFTYLEPFVDQVLLNETFYSCREDESLRTARGAYSSASMVVQYLLPIITVSIAHARICNKLRYRMVSQTSQTAPGSNIPRSPYRQRKNERDSKRKRRTNCLLAFIAVVFAVSWMPLNLCNILIEVRPDLFKGQNVNLIFVICHMLVLTSACTNPVLYGWLNENFRSEFLKVLCNKHCCRCVPQKTRVCCCGPIEQSAQEPHHQTVPIIILPGENGDIENRNGVQLITTCPMSLTMTPMPSSTDFV